MEKVLANFQVIGRCSLMQTISWEEVIKLINNDVYEINFFQDFSKVSLHSFPIETIPTSKLISLIEDISVVDDKFVYQVTHNHQLSYEEEKALWKFIDETIKNDQKAAKKWKKRKKKKNEKKKIDKFLNKYYRNV